MAAKKSIDREKLIQLVRDTPCLWDPSEREYMDADITSSEWQRIGDEIGIEVPSKTAFDILKELPENEEERQVWRFILDTKADVLDQEMRKIGTSLSQGVGGGTYFVVIDQQDVSVKEKIQKVFYDLAFGLKSILKACPQSSYNQFKPAEGVRLYPGKSGNDGWLVGKKDMVQKVSTDMDQFINRTADPATDRDIDSSWENVSLIELPLTTTEQATMYLYKLWNLKCLKKGRVHIQKDEEHFEVKIQYENYNDKGEIEHELKRELQSGSHRLYSCTISFDSKTIQFLKTNSVYKYVNKSLNYSSLGLICAWYIDTSMNQVRLYTKLESEAKYNADKIKKAVQSGWIKVPANCLATQEITKALSDLETRYRDEVEIWPSSSSTTLNFLSTGEKAYSVERDLKALFVTKTLSVSKQKRQFCKRILHPLQNDLENKFQVNLTEQESNVSYGWIIQGGKYSVQATFDEMKTLVDSICTKSESYQSDFSWKELQTDISDIKSPPCNIEVEESLSSMAVDLRDSDITSHRWNLPNGNDIKIVNADYSWIFKSSTMLQIAELAETSFAKDVSFHPDKMSVVMHLPKWKGNTNNEMAMLTNCLNKLFEGNVLEKRSSIVSISYFVQEPKKLDWPGGKFLKEILLALERHKVVVPLIILERSKQIFDRISGVIQDYVERIRSQYKISIEVKTGEIAKEKCGALVNSTSNDLDLSQGAVSATILKAAGDKIQEECQKIMEKRGKLLPTDVEVTASYKLKCVYVFHGAMVAPWHEQTFMKFIYNCLQYAESLGLSSIAFPSIGTGKLGYPVKNVARTMIQTVQNFAIDHNPKSLQKVLFVIYERDQKSLQAFKEQQQKQNEVFQKKVTREKCPLTLVSKVSITGENDKCVEQMFRQIEDRIKEKHSKMAVTLTEPQQQEIPRDGKQFIEARNEPVNEEQAGETLNSNVENGLERNLQDQQTTTIYTSEGERPNFRNKTEEECSVKVCTKDEKAKISKNDFVETLGNYKIQKDQIVWCQYTPREARVKFPNESDADSFITVMKGEKKYTVTKCNIEAVVNIRARLNNSIKRYLQEENYIHQLKSQSGVGIVKDQDGSVTLTGSLLEISAARNILLTWKTEHPIPKSKDATFPAADKNQVGDHQPEPPEIKQEKKITNTVIVEPSNIGDRLVVTEGNDLRIYVQSGSADVAKGEETIHQHDNDDSTGYVAGYRNPVATSKKVNSTVNTDKASPPNISSGPSPAYQSPNDESLMITTDEGIKVYVYKGDMRFLNVDGITNSSNESMTHTQGLSKIISEAAGPKMIAACQKFLKDNTYFAEGAVFSTTAGNLERYKRIVHVCSPVWDNKTNKSDFFKDLSGVIINALREANSRNMSSLAIPAVGSGGRGGPKQLCFLTYPNGILEYSSKFGKKSKVREVHLVDVNDEVVNFIRAACLLSLTTTNKETDTKMTKIPDEVKETFVSYILKDETVDKNYFNMHLSNNVHVVVCDGALYTACNHRHIQQDMSYCDLSYEFSAVVITEDVAFSGKSRSAQLCSQRGGNEYFRNYETMKKLKEKKKTGHVYDILGDANLNYGYIFFAVMPPLGQKAMGPNSSAQLTFFRIIADCFGNVLHRADKWKIGHLCLPVLGTDFYPKVEDYFLDQFVRDIFYELSGFASKRTTKRNLLIHIAVNKNTKLFKAFVAESEKRSKQRHGTSDPGQHFPSVGSFYF